MKDHKNKKLTAPQVENYRNWLGASGHSARDCNAETIAALPALFEEVKKVSPYYDNGIRELHFKVERGPIEDFANYEEMLADGEVKNRKEFEKSWLDWFPDEFQWYTFSFFEEDGYKSIFVNHRLVIEVRRDYNPDSWGVDAVEFVEWMTSQIKECVSDIREGIYNERIRKELPPGLRFGTMTRKALWEVYPPEKEEYFKNITASDVADFIQLMNAEPEERPTGCLPEMSAAVFFQACAMGYRANGYEESEVLSPKELYRKYADGRDEGLMELPEESAEAFAHWYEHRERGGHTWEVCRGGNSTHVSLYVSHSEQGFFFTVDGKSWGRSVEAINFYLAIHRAGLPVVIYEGRKLAERLTGEDKIGVVPDGIFPRYCESYFPDDHILDFMNLPYENRERFAARVNWRDEPEMRLV